MAKFLIVEARFYDHLNDMLVEGARAAIKAAGHSAEVITVPGALYLGLIATLPHFFLSGSQTASSIFGGAAVLILVSVALDTVKQIESQLMQRNYEGFLK